VILRSLGEADFHRRMKNTTKHFHLLLSHYRSPIPFIRFFMLLIVWKTSVRVGDLSLTFGEGAYI
jgi:hypothetical protein